MQTKKCKICNRYRSLDEFWKNKTVKDGRTNICKHCKKTNRVLKSPEKSVHRFLVCKPNKTSDIYKFCINCKEFKPLCEYAKRLDSVDGTVNCCKKCKNKRINKANKRKLDSEYYNLKKDIVKTKNSEYRKNNPYKIRKFSSDRRARTKKAILWEAFSTYKSEIEQFHTDAHYLEMLTKEKFHVDHIIPLTHEKVCGLHVPWNLQILDAQSNHSKNNYFDGTYTNNSWMEDK